MSNKKPNRQVICEVLMDHAAKDKDIVVLCSDSRGSASLTPFAEAYPEQFVEVGIAEQDLVGIAAGLASCGKKAYAASPASFVSTRSYEQAKVDCAYSNTNVKLIGISGGISYGALGMSHHSAQDIAAMAAIPNMRVYLPSDRFQTAKLVSALLEDKKPAYIRVSRNPSEDIYSEENCPFTMDRAVVIETEFADGQAVQRAVSADAFGFGAKYDVTIAACGEMAAPAKNAAAILASKGIRALVLDMYCVKPLDAEAVIAAAEASELVVTAEEHSPFGGLGSMVSQVIGANCPRRVVNLSLPDAPVITGTDKEAFTYYGLTGEGIADTVVGMLGGRK